VTRQRKSHSVELTVLKAFAATITTAMSLGACHSSDRYARHCIDANGVAVADSLCDERRAQPAGYYPYHWYYGGYGYRGIGSRVRGGSFSAPAGVIFVPGSSVGRSTSSSPSGGSHSSGSVSRGGFGSTGGAHGSSS
jgi:hypothetical protein